MKLKQVPNTSVPTVEIVKEGTGRLVINEHDLDEWQAKGFKLVGSEASTSAPASKGKGKNKDKAEMPKWAVPEANSLDEDAIKALSLDQLREYATTCGVEDAANKSAADIYGEFGIGTASE